MNKDLTTQINGKTITGATHKEFIKNCLQEIVDMNKHLPAEERLKNYINYFVDTFSYDFDLRNSVLSYNHQDTLQCHEEDLARLFTDKKGVCDQFAKAFSLLGNLDNEIMVIYCFCDLLINKEQKVSHAINIVAIDKKAKLVDLSSMIHSKEGDCMQNRDAFCMLDFLEYVDALKKENIDFLPHKETNTYRLGACSRLDDFDEDYLILNSSTKFKNQHKVGYTICEEPCNINKEDQAKKSSWLYLTNAVVKVMEKVLDLLAINTLEKM